jgi:hypothetical protein
VKLFRWSSFKKLSREEKIHFFTNIGIGIAIVIILQFFERTDFGENTVNKAFDYIIKKEAVESAKEAIISAKKNKRVAEQISFINLGSVYKKRGTPVITPRDALSKAVEAAYKGNAKIIVLDILLEDRDCCHPEYDQRLRRVFQEMVHKKVSTKVIFPVRIGSDGEVRKNLFEDLIIAYPNFYPAIPYLSATASDRIVRYWVPYENIKDQGRYPVLWNASFLAAALAHGKEKEIEAIGQKMRDPKTKKAHLIKLPHGKEAEISSEPEDIYRNRIRFFLIPQNTFSQYPGGNLFEKVSDVDEVKYVDFEDKIVIIGNADPDAGDIHQTPVGRIPGMYIIGNAINTILLGLQPSHPSVILNMLIELGVIIIAAFVLSTFPPLFIKIMQGVVLISVLSVVSYYYFLQTGIMLNFTFAVAAMGFHDTAMSIEKEMVKKKGKGVKP